MIFAIIVSVAVVLLILGVGTWLLVDHAARQRERLHRRITDVALDDDFDDEHGMLVAGLARGGRRVEQWMDTGSETNRMFIQAGWRAPQPRVLFYAAQAGLPLLVLVGIGFAVASGAASVVNAALYGFMAFAVAVLAPRWMLRSIASNRRERIRAEVPMFIHMLILLFEAGLSTRQALASLVREGRGVVPHLQVEMSNVLRQLDAGGDASTTLQQLGDGLEVNELDNVLGVLRQIDRYGGELRQPLTETLALLEERRSLTMREQVNKLAGQMTVVMVLFFFPALLIFVAGPPFVAVLSALAGFG
ncbi:type II secretion system F family protein [bacterium]|nr:type II secretion system F family protein [bacterium]